jgi:hypothetical protein
MMTPVFLATLGQRPEAITMALDVLLPRYHYAQISILHTDPMESGIREAFRVLIPVLKRDYPDCQIIAHELRASDGKSLRDIENQVTAEQYFYGLLETIRQYRQQFIPVHLLVSGGRKAMSSYAMLAATYLFGEQDHVWVILTEPQWMQTGIFHVPAGERDSVQIVELPLLPTNMPAGAMTNIETILNRRSPRQRFLASLSKQEMVLAETYKQHPYASNEALGKILGKSDRTIENQFRSMYGKMLTYFEMHIDDHHKRQVLLDVLIGRI